MSAPPPWLEERKRDQLEAAEGVRGLPRLPVHRPRARERHHVQAPDRRRRRQELQGRALRPRQRPRGRRRRRRRPARHLLRQPGRRQPALEEPRRRQVRGHHRGRPGSRWRAASASRASFADIDNDGDQDLYVTTVRGGNLLFENDGHGHFRDISAGVGPRTTAGTRRRRSSSTTTATACSTCSSSTSASTPPTTSPRTAGSRRRRGGPVPLPRRLQGRLLGPPEARAGGAEPCCTGTPAATASSTSRQTIGLVDPLVGRRHALDANDDGWPDLYVLNMQGDDTTTRTSAASVRQEEPRSVPETSWGSMGVKVVRLQQRRPLSTSSSPTCTRT